MQTSDRKHLETHRTLIVGSSPDHASVSDRPISAEQHVGGDGSGFSGVSSVYGAAPSAPSPASRYERPPAPPRRETDVQRGDVRRLSVMLLSVSLVVAFLVLAGDQLATRWAYAAERGRIDANQQELARANEVSNAFRMVVKVIKPTVVHINVAGSESLQRELEDEDEDDDRPRFSPRLRPGGAGSGVIFDERGYILTNNHVVADRSEILVRLYDDRAYPATVIGTDRKTDLAVLKIDATDLIAAPFGDSNQMEVGDWVLAFGAPFGLAQTVTHGIISARGRSNVRGVGIEYQDFLQTDAAINPGNSGGPLVNLRGEVVGINTAIATDTEGVNAGIAFTIPSSRARRIAEQLVEYGEVTRGWLGISMLPLTGEDVERFGLRSDDGVLIERIVPGTPASRAGLEIEDILVRIDRQTVANNNDVRNLIADLPPGEEIELEVIRNERTEKIAVTLGVQPPETRRIFNGVRGIEVDALGIEVRTLRPEADPFVTPEDVAEGVRVVAFPGNRARDAGVELNDIIIRCNGRRVSTAHELSERIGRTRGTIRLDVIDASGQRSRIIVPSR